MATITQQLGKFVSGINLNNLPAEVIAKAKSCLLYGLSIAMAAHDSRQGPDDARRQPAHSRKPRCQPVARRF